MRRPKISSYPAHVEEAMKKHYDSLSEKDKRHYAAVEALKLGRGGTQYIATVLGCSRRTIWRGLKDLSAPPQKASTTSGSEK